MTDKPVTVTQADEKIGFWLSAALDCPTSCDEFKQDINNWFNTRTPADSDVLREALLEHHNWHLAQKTPDAEHGYVPAEEYAESGLCERTLAALCHTKAQD